MDFRVAALPAHDHLLDAVDAISASMRRDHAGDIDALIQRWTGSSEQFAKV
jgi:ATP-dependent DNA helicase RecG